MSAVLITSEEVMPSMSNNQEQGSSNVDLPKKKSRGHRCYFCGQKFMQINVLRKHISVHKDRDFICDVCGKAFSSNWGLRKHMKVHTGERDFVCEHCGKAFAQKCTLQFHIKSLHDDKPHSRCLSCGKKIRSSTDNQCWLCRYEARDIVENADQILRQNQTDIELSSMMAGCEDIEISQIPDSECENLKNQDVLVQPVSTAYSLGSPAMIALTLGSESEKSDVDHEALGKPYTCYHCGEKFPNYLAIGRHILIHPNLKPFVCQRCGKDFDKSKDLSQHKLTHKSDRPFMCKICKNYYKTIPILKHHMISHREERPYACKDCGSHFKSVQALRSHIVVHSKVKPLACKICGKTFAFIGNLQRHNRVHTGERPYKCQFCDKAFSQSNGLKAHLMIHQKVFSMTEETCGNCGKNFKFLSNFRKHALTCHA